MLQEALRAFLKNTTCHSLCSNPGLVFTLKDIFIMKIDRIKDHDSNFILCIPVIL